MTLFEDLYAFAHEITWFSIGFVKGAIVVGLLWFLFGCTACASLRPQNVNGVAMYACSTPVQVIPSHNAFVDAALWQGVKSWNERLGWEAFTAERAPTKLYVVVYPIDDENVRARVIYGTQVGCSKALQIRVSPGALQSSRRAELPWIMAHELGHVLGLMHSPHRGDLMFAYVPRNPARFGKLGTVTDEEVALIEALQQCPRTGRICLIEQLVDTDISNE